VADDVDPSNCKLGGDDGMGFGWGNQTVYKIGVNWDFNKEWSFRAGFNYGKAPQRDNEVDNDQALFNMLAPAVTEKHATIGASYRPSNNIEWSFNYSHAFSNTVKGPSAFGPTGDPDIDKNIDSVSLDMEINTFGVSFAYKL
jgi:long-chain fatty acid transport protein